MSVLDKLLALGATPCAGDLLWKHKVMGQFRNGEFTPTAEGLAASDIEEAVVKPVRTKRTKVEAPVMDDEPSIDDLLAD